VVKDERTVTLTAASAMGFSAGSGNITSTPAWVSLPVRIRLRGPVENLTGNLV
jgi:hypothetical protein